MFRDLLAKGIQQISEFSKPVLWSALWMLSYPSWGHALTCAEYNAATELASNNADYTFFTPTTKKQISRNYSELLIRKSAAAFWNTNTATMPTKELFKNAEDPYTDVVETADGEIYALANIGFGGGNSISYLYKFETFELLPIALYDGDCIEQGSTDVFPLEVTPKLDGTAVLQCQVADSKSPVTEFTISVPTEAGVYTGDAAHVTATLNPKFENLDRVTGGKNRIDQSMPPNAVILETSANGAGMNLSFEFDSQRSGDRVVQISLAARQKKDAKVWGKVYTNETGGYWGADAYEYDYPAICSFSGQLISKKFKREIQFQ